MRSVVRRAFRWRTWPLTLVACSVHLCAATLQERAPPLLAPDVTRAIAQELSGARAKQDVQALTQFHRIRGSRGYRDAAEWVRARVGEYGLDDVALISLPADGKIFYGTQRSRPGWDADFAELWEQSNDRNGWRNAIRVTSFSEQPVSVAQDSISGEVAAELIDIGTGTARRDYADKDVRGKLVLTSSQPGAVVQLAVGEYGAAGIVSYARNQSQAWSQDDVTLVRWGHMGAFASPRSFGFMITPSLAATWKERMARGLAVRLHAVVKADQHASAYLIPTAIIPGQDRSREIVLSCHLDHQLPGANDNASGCAAILEIARSLAALIKAGRIPQPVRTLRFLWPPEIEGTIALLNAHPEFASRTLTTLQLDMVGGDTEITKSVLRVYRSPASLPSFVNDVAETLTDFVNRQSLELADTGSASMALADEEGDKRALQAQIGRFIEGSDHQVWSEGSWRIPTVYLADWPDRYIHTDHDSVANIDSSKLRRAMFIAGATAYYLASVNPEAVGRLWEVMQQRALHRLAETAQRAQALRAAGADEGEIGNLWRFHFEYEAALAASIGRYFPEPADFQARARAFVSGLKTALSLPAVVNTCPTELGPSTGMIVYKRAADPKGPMQGMGYDYLRSRLASARLPEPALLNADEVYEAPSYGYEALNLVDGNRTVCQIRNDLAAIIAPVASRDVLEYLSTLEALKLLERVGRP